ncbi:MAG TPA: cytochrome c oxidase assembly protein [Longimicrobiales bacterium]|nr:cytochrome c oxidase assembly protein [Longimicrobiales bacterium]
MLAGLSYASLALLHGGEFSWTRFEVHISTLIGCMLWVAAYYHVIVRWRPVGAAPASRMQQVGFVGGTVLLFLSLNGPLHDLSDNYLFSAHMIQHLIITLIVPPLWLMGLPAWSLRPVLRRPAVLATARALTGPLVAFAIYNVVFIGWHFPSMYNWALVNHNAHIMQHLMFIGAAVLMWWPVVSPVPELDRIQTPVRMLYLFALGIPMSIVSAIITLAEQAMYPWYAAAPRVFENITAVDDQQLGGLIMWVPGMIVFWTAITIIFFRWSTREQREEWRERATLRAEG